MKQGIQYGSLIISLTLLIGCREPNIKNTRTGFVYGQTGSAVEVKEYRIGGCLYIGHLEGLNTDWATHSGECDNVRHNK